MFERNNLGKVSFELYIWNETNENQLLQKAWFNKWYSEK